MFGTPTLKARLPYVVRVRGTWSRCRCDGCGIPLVNPPVSRVAWTLPPTRVWKATEWQIYVAPQGLVGRCVLGKSGYMSKEWAATTDDYIQHRTRDLSERRCQTGDCVPHVVLISDLTCMALAFHG